MNQDRHKNASPPLHAQSESWPLSTTGFNTEGVKMWEVETVVLSLIPLSHYVTCITEFKWASAPSWEGKSCPVFCYPHPLRFKFAGRPNWRDACIGLQKKKKMWAIPRKDEFKSVHACLVVQCLHAHEWAASCHDDFTSSFFMYCTVECALAQQGEWLRANIRQRGEEDINVPHLCIICASQAVLWITTLQLWNFLLSQIGSFSTFVTWCQEWS